MAIISKQAVASFDSYVENVDAAGEMQVSYTKGGVPNSQTIPAQPGPFAMFFDDSNQNFYAMPIDPSIATGSLKFVEIVTQVTP